MKRILDCHASDFKNMTKEELQEKFTEEKGFKFIDEIKNRTFQFGGHEGQRVASHVYLVI